MSLLVLDTGFLMSTKRFTVQNIWWYEFIVCFIVLYRVLNRLRIHSRLAEHTEDLESLSFANEPLFCRALLAENTELKDSVLHCVAVVCRVSSKILSEETEPHFANEPQLAEETEMKDSVLHCVAVVCRVSSKL